MNKQSEDELRNHLEQYQLGPGELDEIMRRVGKFGGDKIAQAEVGVEAVIADLKNKIDALPPEAWRQRAALAARIISLGL
jgi:hypothetical protein